MQVLIQIIRSDKNILVPGNDERNKLQKHVQDCQN